MIVIITSIKIKTIVLRIRIIEIVI